MVIFTTNEFLFLECVYCTFIFIKWKGTMYRNKQYTTSGILNKWTFEKSTLNSVEQIR